MILEEAPRVEPVPGDDKDEARGRGRTAQATALSPSPIPLPLSAKAEPALAEAAERLAAHLQANPDLDPTDVAYSLATTRSAFEHRAVALGSRPRGAARLARRSSPRARRAPDVAQGKARSRPPAPSSSSPAREPRPRAWPWA